MKDSKLTTWLCLGLIAFVLWTKFGGEIAWPTIKVSDKVTAATYVYEKDATAVPSPVKSALDKLNQAGIVATLFEQDSKNGVGDTPAQYKVPLAAAKEAGLPALVVTSGAKVLRVVKDPKTAEQVMEAAK